MVASNWSGEQRERLMKGYELSAIRRIRPQDLMQNIVTVVDNTVLPHLNLLRE